MDPPRPLAGPSSARGSARGGVTPSSSDPGHPGSASQPSLPSIRQLHPYLPPSALSQHATGEASSYMYSTSSSLAPQPAPSEQSVLGVRKGSEVFGVESEADDGEESRGPPKKKRHRSLVHPAHAGASNQDVNGILLNPCRPRFVAGVSRDLTSYYSEKYVTRAEFDELKARYNELSEQVQRLQAATTQLPYFHIGVPPAPGATTEALSTFGSAGPLQYQPMMPPSQPYHLNTQSQGPQRYIKPEEAQTLSRHHQNAGKAILLLFTRVHHIAISSGAAVKKLPRADARTGAASAHRISGSRRPSSSYYRDDPTTPNPPTVTGTLSDLYIDNSASSQTNSGMQMQPSPRRFLDSSLATGPSPRDEDRAPLIHFSRDR
ncbi:hypothetical protein H0H81_008527 [Sphagnurus paluster]|uniref:Uncharacterized protein n=1 Tax=Sphagnurus paluster TaxID=117069 RepID=A0A9P7GKJ3_9AGAR|nr:hypothetical protein H0H81_008527 [Sphagnurus paluster]